ncbi:Gp15 family bacteriophage protein [Convivina praedatoris]|uniref:Bacteriophage Gp15 protein n=1 Tax=Convivina praedatoris TaxID=2880963 RepID=A0ABM9D1T9_9LACO|nr:Gp15 family bacteriophage protein [Convivina sp. LMG 32447]CAH1853329.1 hypothetical protein R077815_00800 [Convivina sp. LMG 32447]CAH1854696.1 hypothetical protein LMG032447_00914 [Convivina sp. LMG 32447]
MFSFTKKPESTIEFNGNVYRINLAFDVVIQAFSVIEDEQLSDAEKANKCFDLLIIDDFPYQDESIKAQIISDLFKYLYQNPYGHANASDDGEQEGTVLIPDFDFEQDAGAIYASFRQQYNIDLIQELGHMHWDVFIALFKNLNSETPIQQIRAYRNDELTGYKDNPEGLSHAAEMKDYFQLDKVRHLEEDDDADKFSGDAQSVFASMFDDAK